MTDLALHAPAPIERLRDRWAEAPEGPRYLEALLSFLAQLGSDRSRESYGYAISEFFDWLELRQGAVPTPGHVTRATAVTYVQWLESPTDEVVRLRLERDTDPRDLLAYQQIQSARDGSNIENIQLALAQADHEEQLELLEKRLGRLVRQHILTRSPSIAELRRSASRTGLDFRPDPHVFVYRLPTRQRQRQRTSTVAARLSALSSFWAYLVDTGENPGDTAALIRHNIWRSHLRRYARGAASQKRTSRAAKTPGLELFCRLLATTYRRSHQQDGHNAEHCALQAAKQAVVGNAQPPLQRAPLSDIRDRAMMLLLLFTGMRVSELVALRRSDLPEDEPLLRVIGKGGRERLIRVPEPALQAVRELQRTLIPPEQRPRLDRPEPLRALLSHPDAPLIPPIRLWGRAAARQRPTEPSQIRALSRQAVDQMLKRRAEKANISAQSADRQRVHVHGIRHLAAQYALDRGVPLPIVQAVMGHESLATTGMYLEQFAPEALSLWPEPAAEGMADETDPTIIEAQQDEE